jgi:hypothetical protein
MSFLPTIVMVVTFLFGIFPATLLLIGAAMLAVAGLLSLAAVVFEPQMVNGARGAMLLLLLLAIPVPIMAGYGLVGLFYAAGGLVTTRVARWLVAGIVANVAAIGFVAIELRWSWDSEDVLMLSPLAVACGHLAWFVRSRYRSVSA